MPSLSISRCFANLPDPRDHRARRHPLLTILTIALCAMLCGADDYVAMQQFGKAKSNEIDALPRVLAMLEITGCIVTPDAMGCQKEVAAQIVEQRGDYVLALKGNHPPLEEDMVGLFSYADAKAWEGRPHAEYTTFEKDHGRIETRRYTLVPLSGYPGLWSDVQEVWKGLASLGRVVRTCQVGEKTTVETRYYLGSLAGEVRAFGGAVRGHFGIENGLHWSLDVVFGEEASRVRKDHAPANLSSLRKVALNLLNQAPPASVGKKNRRLRAGWDNRYLEEILGR